MKPLAKHLIRNVMAQATATLTQEHGTIKNKRRPQKERLVFIIPDLIKHCYLLRAAFLYRMP